MIDQLLRSKEDCGEDIGELLTEKCLIFNCWLWDSVGSCWWSVGSEDSDSEAESDDPCPSNKGHWKGLSIALMQWSMRIIAMCSNCWNQQLDIYGSQVGRESKKKKQNNKHQLLDGQIVWAAWKAKQHHEGQARLENVRFSFLLYTW